MTAHLDNATVNVTVEVRLASDDGFAIVRAPVLILDPELAAAVAATLRANGLQLIPAVRAHAMADLIDNAIDRAASLAETANAIAIRRAA